MPRTSSAPPAVYNRLRAVLLHVPFYTSDSLARLADDTGIPKPTIWRYASLKQNPPPMVASIIARAISSRARLEVRSRDLFSRTGRYRIQSACELMGCKGCLPPQAWDERTDTLKPEWRHRKPSEWSHQDCRYWQYEAMEEADEEVDEEADELRDQEESNIKPGEWSRVEADPSSPGAHQLIRNS